MKRYLLLITLVFSIIVSNSCEKSNPDSESSKDETADKKVNTNSIDNDENNSTANNDTKAKPEEIFIWSEPVNGLIARIEGVYRDNCNGDVVFIRLKNVGGTEIEVPTCNPTERKNGVLFKVMCEVDDDGEKHWQTIEKYDDEGYHNRSGNRIDRPNRILKKGESAIAFLCGRFGEESKNSAEIKVVINIEKTDDSKKWAGKIETHSFPIPLEISHKEYEKYYDSLNFPTYFPEFSEISYHGYNDSMFPSVWDIFLDTVFSNYVYLDQLKLYTRKEVISEIEKRFSKIEKPTRLKFIYASILIELGSNSSKHFLLHTKKSTDYYVLSYRLAAMKSAAYEDNRPDWLINELILALEDEREVSYTDSWSSKTITRKVSHIVDKEVGVPYVLGYVKCRKAVPILIKLFKKNNDARSYISALSSIGDQRTIPVFFECFENYFTSKLFCADDDLPDYIKSIIWALVRFEEKKTVPILIEHIYYPACLEALIEFRDRRALEPFKKIVESNGIVKGVKHNDDYSVKNRLASAKIGLAVLSDDPTPELCKLLFDMKLGEFNRRDVVVELGYHPDKRAIPYLVKAIKTDPSGSVVNTAIEALSFYKYKEAVKGLIECFDADFDGKDDWKRAYTPEMFRDNVAESLRIITGQKIGTDNDLWLKWYEEKGKFDSSLK